MTDTEQRVVTDAKDIGASFKAHTLVWVAALSFLAGCATRFIHL